jgi:hypothetical protein
LEDVLHAKRRQLSFVPKYARSILAEYKFADYIDASSFTKPFSTFQLLKFSHEVCNAMEYLASKKVQF